MGNNNTHQNSFFKYQENIISNIFNNKVGSGIDDKDSKTKRLTIDNTIDSIHINRMKIKPYDLIKVNNAHKAKLNSDNQRDFSKVKIKNAKIV